ncbi:MAG: c-type cytochrome [Bryobacteraceae bacterium]
MLPRLLSTVAGATLAATLAAQTPEIRNPRTSAADVAAGAKTFRSHCAECHGLNGEGRRGPNLTTGVYFHGSSDAELLANISDGIPGTEMPGLFYSPDRVWQVIAYLRSVAERNRGNASGDAAAGANVYRTNGCANCHRIAGQGGRMGPDLTSIGRTRATEHLRAAIVDPNSDVRQRYWVVDAKSKSGTVYTGFLMNEDTWNVQMIDLQDRLHSLDKSTLASYKVSKTSKMPSFQGKIANAELANLVAYLSSLGGAR